MYRKTEQMAAEVTSARLTINDFRWPGWIAMSDGLFMIGFGMFLIAAAFLAKGVSDKAWRGGTFSPPTTKLRFIIFAIGTLSLALGISRLVQR